mmetsp:Transcript_7605/g.18357  ORF Transcript_7605/g.18357 Transcript_7605/m.18357 type:complete len:319 (-) Transcript_7605:934-1890(-)
MRLEEGFVRLSPLLQFLFLFFCLPPKLLHGLLAFLHVMRQLRLLPFRLPQVGLLYRRFADQPVLHRLYIPHGLVGLLLGVVLRPLCDAQNVQLRRAFLVHPLEVPLALVDRLHVLVATNYLLQVLQEPLVRVAAPVLCLGLHQRNLLDLALRNQKAVVLQVDPALHQHGLHLLEIRFFPVQLVEIHVVVPRRALQLYLAALHHSVLLSFFVWVGYVDDVLHEDGDAAVLTVRHGVAVVDQLAEFVLPDRLRALPERELEGVDGVRLPTAVRADHRGEVLVEGPHLAHATVRLEVLAVDLADHQPRLFPCVLLAHLHKL